MVLSGKINMEAFVETRPMSTIQDTFAEAHKTPPMRRIVLTPDF
jgi:6-hydroxycyclohex-1-ene-1-carbonyl-CoA dehydrogenase